jgi:hypothetical protein
MLKPRNVAKAIAGCVGLAIVFSLNPCQAQIQKAPIRSGFELAISRKQLRQGSDYSNLVGRAVVLVEQGYSPLEASQRTGVKVEVLIKLIQIGERSIPMVEASLPSLLVPKDNVKSLTPKVIQQAVKLPPIGKSRGNKPKRKEFKVKAVIGLKPKEVTEFYEALEEKLTLPEEAIHSSQKKAEKQKTSSFFPITGPSRASMFFGNRFSYKIKKNVCIFSLKSSSQLEIDALKAFMQRGGWIITQLSQDENLLQGTAEFIDSGDLS